MSEATHHAPENDAINWRALAELFFPAEALRTAPAFNPLAVVGKSV